MLLALAAASIPLLLHLLNLRRSRTVDFSSVRFLKELQRSKLRSFRLQQILLLLLRLGVVVFTVLAFSGPVIGSSGSLAGTRSIVLIVDNTWSTIPLSDDVEGEEAWRRVTLDLIESLADGDEYGLIALSNPDAGPGNSLRREKGWGVERIRRLETDYTSGGYAPALRSAAHLLEGAAGERHVWLVTDRQRVNLAGIEQEGEILPEGVALHIISPEGDPGDDDNVSIDSVRVVVTSLGGGEGLEVIASVTNRSRSDVERLGVTLRLPGGSGGREEVDLAAGERRQVVLRGRSGAGGLISGSVAIEGDGIPWDNSRYFTVDIPRVQAVSVIAEGDRTSPVERIFGLVPAIRPTRIEWGEVSSTGEDSPLYVVVDPEDVSTAAARALAEGVRSGGGLLLFGGPGLSGSRNMLADELGLALRDASGVPEGAEPLHIERLQRSHPLFEGVFDPATTGRIPSPSIRQLLPSAAGEPVIALDNGLPLVSDIALGAGRIIYVALPPRSSWSNLHESSLLVPLVLRSIAYLAQGSSREFNVLVGNRSLIELEGRAGLPSTVELVGPGDRAERVGLIHEGGGSSVPVAAARTPGNWTIRTGEDLLGRFSVNGDPRESDLDQVSAEELSEALASVVGSPELMTESDEMHAGGADRDRIGLWQILLLLALLCAVAELFVGRGSGSRGAPRG